MENSPVRSPQSDGVGSMNPSTNNTGKVLIPLLAGPPHVGQQVASLAANENAANQQKVTASPTSFRRSKSSRSSALPEDRLQRCRERNRIHARKTRLRKKEHMQGLQQRADELKQQQLRLRQIINEKNTASILVGFATSKTDGDSSAEDPRVEELLRKPAEEIPDSSKIPELPALILPGQHASKKAKAESDALVKKVQDELPSEGFDLELLAKDRSKCTPEELDQIRRERNRMHAKRTRDRKRLFMEEMGEICRQLEEENDLLRAHLKMIDPDYHDQDGDEGGTDVLPIAPSIVSSSTQQLASDRKRKETAPSVPPTKRPKPNGNHLKYLFEVACAFESGEKPDDSASSTLLAVVTAISEASPKGRRRKNPLSTPTTVGC